ncbi:MAG: SRPBCC family protein, partial [Micrococcales bacterium]|nr:SRPBCC family protein [Micrococcales bacterium]
MQLTHAFDVPAPVGTAWATFMDLREVGECFPGASVTDVNDEGFTGSVKVKLGPIALVYSGTGRFLKRDEAARRAVIEGKGKDKRGNGTAGATATIQLTDQGDGTTHVDVTTDLAVTGKPAQFGRGVMQDVSDKLLRQFITCLEGKLASGEGPAAPGSTADAPVDGSGSANVESGAAPQTPASATPSPASAQAPASASPLSAPPAQASTQPPGSPDGDSNDSLDLGMTVLPVLARSYGPHIAVGV